jgi:predicted TIM-barrel enzyme
MNLNHRVSVIVPSVSSGHAISPAIVKRAVETTARTLAAIAGGATTSKAVGYWLAADGTLVREPVTQVWAYTDETHAGELAAAARTLAAEFKATLEQEAIAIEIDAILEIL